MRVYNFDVVTTGAASIRQSLAAGHAFKHDWLALLAGLRWQSGIQDAGEDDDCCESHDTFSWLDERATPLGLQSDDAGQHMHHACDDHPPGFGRLISHALSGLAASCR